MFAGIGALFLIGIGLLFVGSAILYKVAIFLAEIYARVAEICYLKVEVPLRRLKENRGSNQKIIDVKCSNLSKARSTIAFQYEKCENCGMEFISTSNESSQQLHEIEWSINGKEKLKRLVCKDCLAAFINGTRQTYSRNGESEASESAKKFTRFFTK